MRIPYDETWEAYEDTDGWGVRSVDAAYDRSLVHRALTERGSIDTSIIVDSNEFLDEKCAKLLAAAPELFRALEKSGGKLFENVTGLLQKIRGEQ